MRAQPRILDKKLTSKYEQNVTERRQFRNQMRAELKAMAKQSFIDEFEMWRSAQKGTGSAGKSDDGSNVDKLQQEIKSLHHMVEQLSHGQSAANTGASVFPWSSPIVANQRSRVPESPSSPQDGNRSNFFILSTAPITGLDSVVHQQLAPGAALGSPTSLLEQANRFAEINSLFKMPDHLEDGDIVFNKQFEEFTTEQEAERARQRELARQHKQKLESTMVGHRERLEKARQSPRRVPENKPSHTNFSPRTKVHRFTESRSAPANMATTFPPQSRPNPNANAQTGSLYNLSDTGDASLVLGETAMTAATNFNLPGTSAASPSPSPKKDEKPVTLREDEFTKQTDTLEEQIKRLVKDVVHQELVGDCREHHYTQRMQKRTVAKHENLLVKKIEKALGDKVKEVQQELTKLKEVKLLKLQKDEDQWAAAQDVTSILGEGASNEQIQGLTAEVKSVVTQALRYHFGRGRDDDEEEHVAGSSRSVQSRVHGSINTRSSFGMKPGGMGDFGKEAPAPAPILASLVEEVIVKPKSKAERMLGITTDNRSGLPVNDAPQSAKPVSGAGGSFFGIGSLFSSKPGSTGSPAMSDFGRSSKPQSGMHSGLSGGGGGFGSKHALDTIVDEMSEERTDKDRMRGPHTKSTRSLDGDGTSTKTDGGSAVNSGVQAELAAEEVVYRDLMANLVTLAEVKSNVKKELQDWETDFQRKNNREPTVEDKAAINDRFLAYKMICTQVQEAKDQAKASEEKMKEIKARLSA